VVIDGDGPSPCKLLHNPLPAALIELASITDFDLSISSTADPLLAREVVQMRPGFVPEQHLLRFHPNGMPSA
jgi:hypothetical protein